MQMQAQAQKVEKCNQELKEAILAQGKFKEQRGEVLVTMAEVGGIVAHVKSELLEIEKGEKEDFFVDEEAQLPHAQKLQAIIEAKYGQVEASLDQTWELVQKAHKVINKDKAFYTGHELEVVIMSTKMRLEATTNLHNAVESYLQEVDGKVLIANPKPIWHIATQTTKPLDLVVNPCPICSYCFQRLDIIIAPQKCMYHLWCVGRYTYKCPRPMHENHVGECSTKPGA